MDRVKFPVSSARPELKAEFTVRSQILGSAVINPGGNFINLDLVPSVVVSPFPFPFIFCMLAHRRKSSHSRGWLAGQCRVLRFFSELGPWNPHPLFGL